MAPTSAGSGRTADLEPGADLHQLLALHFMVNAFRAGTIVAVIAAAIGWFMVLRRQSFAGHTLAVVSFPGAAGAIWLGISATAGYFAGSIVAALVIAMVPRSTSGRARSEESAVIGTVQAFALACGVLFVSLYGGLPRQPHRPALRHLPRDLRRPGGHPGPGGRGRPGRAGRHRPPAAVRHASTPTWPGPGASRSGGCRWCSCCCSDARPPRSARSPGPCWSSPCWSCRPPPPSRSPPGPPSAWPSPWCWPWSSPGCRSLVAFYSSYPVGFYVSTIGFGVYVAGRRGPGPGRPARLPGTGAGRRARPGRHGPAPTAAVGG